MIKHTLTISFAAVLLLFVGCGDRAEVKETNKDETFSGYIEVTNSTGFTIHYLYISHEFTDNWEEDVLGEDVLVHGNTYRITVNGYPTSIFDVRAADEDGDTYTLYGIDISIHDVNLTLENLDLN
jgi:hypothetical protein